MVNDKVGQVVRRVGIEEDCRDPIPMIQYFPDSLTVLNVPWRFDSIRG